MFEDTRRMWASRCGKIEHYFGRLMFVPMLIGSIYNYIIKDNINMYLFGATIVCWFIYILSHTLEKFFYGHLGPRG